jgi:hypothetical protein
MEQKHIESSDDLATFDASATPPLFHSNGIPPLDEGPDPFDPAAFRLPQDFSVALKAKKALVTMHVTKPKPHWWVRVHPDAGYHLTTYAIEMEQNTLYLLPQSLAEDLISLIGVGMLKAKTMYLAVTRRHEPFFWPVPFQGPEDHPNEWTSSMREAVHMAVSQWVRLVSNRGMGAYDVYDSEGPDPVWPTQPMQQLLRIAFKDRIISTLDHPIIQQLQQAL